MKSLILVFMLFSSFLIAKDLCQGFGPQTPRDITNHVGTNPVEFGMAPEFEKLNLCNIHFHKGAEHKGPEFSLKIESHDHEQGFMCNKTSTLSATQLMKPKVIGCENLQPGDTIEVHWVYTSCDVSPGPGLGSCLSQACANPTLRVEAETFLVANDESALSFDEMTTIEKVNGKFQALEISSDENAIKFRGSTTGPSYDQTTCSPLQVTWNVRPSCKIIDINTVHNWCMQNEFNESAPHGVRKLVTAPELLSEIP